MGANASKVARKLPTVARPDTLKKAPLQSPATLEEQIKLASELKPEFLEEDGRDPHLDRHLKTIGTVSIPPTITKMRTTDNMLGIVSQRQKADAQELTSEGTITIDSFFSLLEERKRLSPGEADLESTQQGWTKKYGIDPHTLSTVLKYYSTMAIMPVALDDKEDRRAGVWVTDRVDWETKVKQVEERNKLIEAAKQKAIEDNNRIKSEQGSSTSDQKKLKDLFEEDF
ncbi:hypothetical protein BY458DRAFT_484502 [Sporodiniella umbellata]|nr:hypothetical protein BY458DRAFT_484502 [Sporodiniella umbellata]